MATKTTTAKKTTTPRKTTSSRASKTTTSSRTSKPAASGKPSPLHTTALGAPGNPFAAPASGAEGALAGVSDDVFGTFSLEKFVDSGPLTYTHEDAWGWYQYLARFNQANFRYVDDGVQVWQYEEAFDNYQDTYGMDAVKSVYHSGHGGMDGNGVFYAPLGAKYDGRSTAVSTNMGLGDEQVRYVFWSTCFSLRTLGGHSPFRTWWNPNRGFRMLFGFETVSIDSPNYGKFFWEQWNKPQPLWRAWCDASWRISTHQSPSVVASGADANDASNRLFNERLLYWEAVPRNYYQWTWYDVANGVRARRERNLALPDNALIAEFEPVGSAEERLALIAERHDVEFATESALPAVGAFSLSSQSGDQAVTLAPDGSYEITFGEPVMSGYDAPDVNSARSKADGILDQHGLTNRADLVFDQVRHTMTAGASPEDPSTAHDHRAVETTVQYRQVINGLPTVGSGGEVTVTFDSRGELTRITDATRAVDRLTDRMRTTTASPGGGASVAAASAEADPERLLAAAWRQQALRGVGLGLAPVSVDAVPASTEVGYELDGSTARLVARREVEIDCGGGYLKRYPVTAPILA